jgi:hypothetical protein
VVIFEEEKGSERVWSTARDINREMKQSER